jgi:CheY-like chemotaxis protein
MIAPPLLLVEDNDDDAKLTIRALKKCKVLNEVVVARDGPEALDYLFGRGPHVGRDMAVQPQVVLLDLSLPRIHGLEVLRQIRENPVSRFLPVVVLTSSKEEEDVVQSYTLGANCYVRKPIEFNEFAEAVKALGLFWILVNQTAPARW